MLEFRPTSPRNCIWWASTFLLLLVDIDYSTLAKADNSISSRSSMVGEHLQRIEEQGEALRPVLEPALKKAATTAFAGE
ncbi:hypothetical protein AZE42_11521 [Rhizopogon vesiculosus]|uniref:Uncharacterized protein n=1 Tax=Rhizopogon vesiculosus TaxID=180088 RepID=A0A1J8QET5_9AGAM|nr:hypothetical protein AZE42_11521 [Rhizopogon vesiculosus]